ncbi:MAG TPA: helix-turn-helix domain-containing protein, partial [Anaerolineaceae bacterium]
SQQQGGGGGGAPSGGAPSGTPAVMTPAEAANVLRVSEEDIMAAINAGELKARKIGSAYRISKEALDDYLKG